VPEIKRVFVEKKDEFNIDARSLLADLKYNLGIGNLKKVRVLNRYDVLGITKKEFLAAKSSILAEPPVDRLFEAKIEISRDEFIFGIEYLPGQYDQRADSAAQCIQILTRGKRPLVATARIIVLSGDLSKKDLRMVRQYLINPVDSREAAMAKLDDLNLKIVLPGKIKELTGFTNLSKEDLIQFIEANQLAMSVEDIEFCQKYFKTQEKRDPSITEIKVLDTYWSDHCRHTTFHALINHVEIEDDYYARPIKEAFSRFLKNSLNLKQKVPFGFGCSTMKNPDISLMNIATLSMKEMRSKGLLEDLEISNEVNACSVIRRIRIDDRDEEWLIMFKNETHNHPTEIEPFGGAATCLGGAIRDPLSGRAYVYQAMRITGSGDPRARISDTLPGKLPQRKITTEAALGFSSYGNQIGLATGLVSEIYHRGYISKRMEVGAVIGAVARSHVKREEPQPGDAIILVGGRTGRDGIGGATGSSKKHTQKSIYTAGAEVQKGNPPEERKLQRLFRNPEITGMIKKCNDFGAGGVSVAIGELAAGLDINLDKIPKKYEGLDGTDLALSESQERMAVVLSEKDIERFLKFAGDENLEATEIARVTATDRLKIHWDGEYIVDIARDFINTHGIRKKTNVFVRAPKKNSNYFNGDGNRKSIKGKNLKKDWIDMLQTLNNCCQAGLVEMFDSTIGAGSVLLPFGGRYQLTPIEAMVAKIPVLDAKTRSGTVMSYGFNPEISMWSPFHAGIYAVVEAVAKIVCTGGEFSSIRFTLQEYFEKLGENSEKWGKPFAALLGAYYALSELQLPSIGGKDSMSGSFENLHVPPTLIAFAVNVIEIDQVISPEFKSIGNPVVCVILKKDQYECPLFDDLKLKYSIITRNIIEKKILSAQSVREGGLAFAVSKMCFGNKIGFKFSDSIAVNKLFFPEYGSIILELDDKVDIKKMFEGIEYKILGSTQREAVITVNDARLPINDLILHWMEPLKNVFPYDLEEKAGKPVSILFPERNNLKPRGKIAKPRVLITVFPGTNCEYDTEVAFKNAGGKVDSLVFKNLLPADINQSLKLLKSKISNSQIIVIPGGFSSGDEPDGSGKFIAAVFRNPEIKDAVMEFLTIRDGLMLGICNGFQALIKLGLVVYGDIREMDEMSPTLTFNQIGRHVSRMINTKVVSVLSPWFFHSRPGEVHAIPVSHGEGRFVAEKELFKKMLSAGQIATQYVDLNGNPSNDFPYNPNGSMNAVEGITSPDGRVLGKMAHSERKGLQVAKNIPGNKDQKLFESGIDYFS
jgi:phosphoribosylformylglycinamidine synthase